jgi:hypothetical protein
VVGYVIAVVDKILSVAGDLDMVVRKVWAVVGYVSTMAIYVIVVVRNVLLVMSKVLPVGDNL